MAHTITGKSAVYRATVALRPIAVRRAGSLVAFAALLAHALLASADTAATPQLSDVPHPMDTRYRSSLEMAATLSPRAPGPDFTRQFDLQVVRIAMRDGVELHTEIYTPRDRNEALPIILARTPYGLNQTEDGYTTRLRKYPELIRDGYIFVFQDTRGRNDSGGEYVSLGPAPDLLNADATDDSTDTYDTIDWLVANVDGNNGRVGTLGISYGGFLVTRALLNPHPALKAASPQATCADMFIGDDWHHNGAFRLDYSFSWIASMEQPSGKGADLLNRYDAYEAFLELGPLGNVNKKLFHGIAPSWNAFAEHPNLDDYWRKEMCGVLPFIQPTTVPTLNVAGWFDAEDFYGPIEVYKRYEETDRKDINRLVVGPWYHGGWSFAKDGRRVGAIDFESDVSRWYRDEVQAPWFAHWLKDGPRPDLPEVLAFRTGVNKWDQYDAWPPENHIERRSLYLRENGQLSFTAPGESQQDNFDTYVSDPANPVPYRRRPIGRGGWPEWQLEDQRFADGRPDVLTWVSDPLQEDLTITGEPIAELFASTSGSDSDWIVKLIDVYPDPYKPEPYMSGFQFMVAGEVFRGRYRNSFEVPEAVQPGEAERYSINLRSRNHTFQAGHRIMVQVQSTWFPLIDRNPQRYVPNIYEATEADFMSAEQRIYRSPDFPSYLDLPVNGTPPRK